jgi:hypothetical protein
MAVHVMREAIHFIGSGTSLREDGKAQRSACGACETREMLHLKSQSSPDTPIRSLPSHRRDIKEYYARLRE